MNKRAVRALQTKLRQFADGLTPEEQAQLRAMRAESHTDELTPSLRDKLQRSADGLTPAEEGQLRLLMQRAGAGAPPGEEADARGHMIAQDRLQPGPDGTGGGGDLGGLIPAPYKQIPGLFAAAVRSFTLPGVPSW